MPDEKPPQPKLPPNIPVMVVDTVYDRTEGEERYAYTFHAGCDRAQRVAEALHEGKPPPPPEVLLESGRVPCMPTGKGPAMVNSKQYRDNYEGIFGSVPKGEA